MEMTVKMSEKEFIEYTNYKKDKRKFFEEFKNKLFDFVAIKYQCPCCKEMIWVKNRLQVLNEEYKRNKYF